MLKNLDPLLTPELLSVLAGMGHGDDLALVDVNFPATSVAKATQHGRVIHLPGVDLPRAVESILSVLPLDTFVEDPVRRMTVVDDPSQWPPVQVEVRNAVARAGSATRIGDVERYDFYEAAKSAYAVVATGERRFYGCFLLRKGVIGPDER